MSFDWQTEDRDWEDREPPRHSRPRPADLPPLNEALIDAPEEPADVAAPGRPARPPRSPLAIAAQALPLPTI